MTRSFLHSSIAVATATFALVTLSSACRSGGFDSVRYHNREPVKVVNDRVNTPKKPSKNPFYRLSYHVGSYSTQPIREFTSFRGERRALNTNSMDEVPDSTWFTNRIGVREVSLDEMRRGANRPGGPMPAKPWTVKSSKVGGKSLGFIIKDANGDTYLLKFDLAELPEAETAADVIAAKIFWAIGFNVAEDYVVNFKREDLVVAPDAKIKPAFGDSTPLTEEKLSESLKEIAIDKDGNIRGLASRFLSGAPLDGWSRKGTRPGDPNDTIPHEMRRELRGAYAFFSWLSHSDIKEDNTLDMWVEDPNDPSIHYVMHYLIDIGKTFGVQEAAQKMRYVSHEYIAEPQSMLKQLLTLGLRKRSWEGRRSADLVGVGLWESKNYDPGNWKSATPNYLPLLRKDKFDAFWGSKILIRFTKDQLRAAIETGELSDPRSSEYILRVLIERQRKTAAYWFNRVNPTDDFTVETSGETSKLCFDDLMVKYDLGGGTPTYKSSAYDYDGKKIGDLAIEAASGAGRVCTTGVRPSSSKDGYVIIKLSTRRAGSSAGPTLVHLAVPEGGGDLRVIGLRRL